MEFGIKMCDTHNESEKRTMTYLTNGIQSLQDMEEVHGSQRGMCWKKKLIYSKFIIASLSAYELFIRPSYIIEEFLSIVRVEGIKLHIN